MSLNHHVVASVLLVEADEGAGDSVALLLADRFDVDTASDTASALELVRRRQAQGLPAYDALLIDLELGTGRPDGFECLQHLRGCEGYSELAVPAVAITDVVTRPHFQRCSDAGFEATLHRLLLPEVLEAELELLLEEDAILSSLDVDAA